MERITRRGLLKGVGSVAATGVISQSRWPASASRAPESVKTKLSQFDYPAVKLLDGPMLQQFNQNHAFFMAMNDDALLKPFRQPAGMPAPGDDLGGWYNRSKDFDPPKNMTGYIAGHNFGQFLSGLARAYAITGDTRTQAKVHGLVRDFAATVSPKFYENYPLPAYTFDKINCGLIDAHEFTADPMALGVLGRATDAVLPYLPPKALNRTEMKSRPHKNVAFEWDESYTLPENFFLAYQRSGNPRYRDLARRFLEDDTYFNPLSEGKNVLPGEHAYSHLNALCSASQAYLMLGSEKHLRAARNGFDFVRNTQSFATGGWGPDEQFRAPNSGDLGASLSKTHASFETPCGAYGHFKVSRYLLCVTGYSRYGDSMERVLYNTILGAKPIQPDGRSFYYSDYNNSASKFFHHDKWPCCAGTFPQITADYGISSYFRSRDGIYVNLFVPSQLHWRQGSSRCMLEQTTLYPYASEVALRLRTDRPQSFTIYLRVPAWAGSKTTVAVSGHRFPVEVQPGSFVALQREWKDGDRIEYTVDLPQYLEAVDAVHPSTVALLSGPLTLFAVDMVDARFTKAQLLNAKQRAMGSSAWTVHNNTQAVTFRSFPAIDTEKYRLYHEVET